MWHALNAFFCHSMFKSVHAIFLKLCDIIPAKVYTANVFSGNVASNIILAIRNEIVGIWCGYSMCILSVVQRIVNVVGICEF